MTLSIIILNYKSKNLTRECVKRVLGLGLQIDYEVIVVDNGSGDGVGDMLREKFGDLVEFVQLPRNIGMGAGNNAGIKKASGKYIMILNPDGIVCDRAIETLISFLESNPKAGLVAPKILNPDGTHQRSVHRFPKFCMPFYRRTLLGKTKHGKEYLKKYTASGISQSNPVRVDWVFGPAFIIPGDLMKSMGGYDERYFLFFEDTDLCRKVWDFGYEVWYVPDAKVVHLPHRLSGHHLGIFSIRKKATWHHIVSWLKYFWKWRDANKESKS